MKVTKNDDTKIGAVMPRRPFLARHQSIHGPLCIVNERIGHGEKRFGVFFLEGCGGPAIWDEWSGVTQENIAKNFIPITHSVTFENEWP